MITVNRYLRGKNIPLRILACDYEGAPIFPLVTNRKDDPTASLRHLNDTSSSKKAMPLVMSKSKWVYQALSSSPLQIHIIN
ncbi:hypothetical protein BYT27DRAFT_7193506, partial [Phlegmacium glaucopus]